MKLDDVDGEGFQVEDRRGRGGAGGGLGTVLGGKGAKAGIPALILVVIVALISQAGGGGGGSGTAGIDDILGQLSGAGATSGSVPAEAPADLDQQEQFVADVGTLLEDYWSGVFEQSGERFEPTSAVVFDSPTDTGGCGVGQPEAGPFYCPPSKRIFIDFGFYEQLERQLGFGGDFAMAYVLAHEYGHHIQNLLGIDDQVREAQQGASQAEANALSVQLELQADCFAGVWARSVYEDQRLEDGDLDEAIDAAQAVGDDAIQGENARQESFTHGSSADRKRWFRAGFDSGDPSSCDTFS